MASKTSTSIFKIKPRPNAIFLPDFYSLPNLIAKLSETFREGELTESRRQNATFQTKFFKSNNTDTPAIESAYSV